MALEIEADLSLSDEPGSLMDRVMVGLISKYRTAITSRRLMCSNPALT
jgi:hypothetical protein